MKPRRVKPRQLELRQVGQEFNLVSETGEDPLRVEMDKLREAQRLEAAREYAAKMQRSLAECPGFIACDAPASEQSKGRLVINPANAFDARNWLKHRFHASENLELSADGLCIDIVPKIRAKRSTGRKVKVSFGKVEQFFLDFR